jgi:adenosylcobinamide-GDP ribazoletransferase
VRRQIILFQVAMAFLTRLPVPALPNFQSSWLSQSARYFPVVGVLVGAINIGVWWLLIHWLPTAVSIGLMLAVSLLVTGAFHEDGFADACDGFGGGTTRDRVLAIMKDSRIGAYGAIGIVVMLGLKWTTLAAIPAAALPLMVIGAHMVSRWCASGLIWGMHYVRVDADAKAKPFADGLCARDWILSGVLGVMALLPWGFASDRLPGFLEARMMCTSAVAAAITGLIAAGYCRRRIGGYTGDCLGAVQQLTELAFLLAGLGSLGLDSASQVS